MTREWTPRTVGERLSYEQGHKDAREKAEQRVRELEAALGQLVQAVKPVMGTLNHYIGPAARTATSHESRDRYEALVRSLRRAALEEENR